METSKVKNEQHPQDYSSIQILPDELLTHIFQFMDKNTLLSASKCCPRWHNLIENDNKTMENFEILAIINYSKNAKGKIQFKKDFPKGKYQNLFITTWSGWRSRVNDISDKDLSEILAYKNFIKKLTLHEMSKLPADKIVMSFDMLEHLVITNYTDKSVEMDVYDHNDLEKLNNINLPNLQVLEAHSSYQFLIKLKAPNLKSLKMSEHERFGLYMFIMDSFLETCKNLKEFHITGPICNLMFDVEKIPFQLESLVVENLELMDENFADFLMSQSQSLKSLSFVHYKKFPISLSVIFEELKLEYLEINVNYIENEVFNTNSIKKLVAYNYQSSPARNPQTYNSTIYYQEFLSQRINPLSLSEKYAKVLSACKNVKEFSLFGCEDPETLYYIFETLSVNNQYLKVLNLTTIPQLPNPSIKFHSLERLEIDSIDTDKHVRAIPYILNYFPNLKILQINDCIRQSYNFTPEFVTKIISTSVHLEEIYMGFELRETEENSLISNCFKESIDSGRNLKILKFLNGQITRTDPGKFIEFNQLSSFNKSELNNFSGAMERKFSNMNYKYGKSAGEAYYLNNAGHSKARLQGLLRYN